jgi:stress-induced morphogen
VDLLQEIQNVLTEKFTQAHVHVSDMTGTKDHLEILVVSDDFKGIRLLEQHRMVMQALQEKFQEGLHAVKIKTYTNEGFQRQKKLQEQGHL